MRAVGAVFELSEGAGDCPHDGRCRQALLRRQGIELRLRRCNECRRLGFDIYDLERQLRLGIPAYSFFLRLGRDTDHCDCNDRRNAHRTRWSNSAIGQQNANDTYEGTHGSLPHFLRKPATVAAPISRRRDRRIVISEGAAKVNRRRVIRNQREDLVPPVER